MITVSSRNKYEQALDNIESFIKYNRGFRYLTQDLSLLAQLVNKETAKTLNYEADEYDEDGNLIYDMAYCPKCNKAFEYGINDWESNYCSECGQKLDWRGTEE